ncbi:MAG: AMP-binding protein [Deltaproteobacteria bacterium]|nr:AMP-binding protein [Deltaproteobacteria bacterium]
MTETARIDKKLDTIPKLLLDHARRRGNSPANRHKDLGFWQSWTWSEVAEEVRNLACGLAKLGFKRGDKLAVIGDNRPRLYWSMVAAQALGGIPVPLYQDSVAEEMVYVLENSDAKFAIVQNQEQTDKLLEIKDRLPHLEYICYEEPRGMRDYTQEFVFYYKDVQQTGRAFHGENPDYFLQELEQGQGSDISIFLYTSGTTGKPKGVVLTADNLIITARNSIDFDNLTSDEEVLAYLPMAWVGDNIFSLAQAYVIGFCVNCPENPETVMTDLKEIGPTYYFAPPAIYETVLTKVMIRMEDAGKIKRSMFNYFMELAKSVGIRILDGKAVSFSEKLLYSIGQILVYGPLRNNLGLSRTRLAYTAGEAIGPEIFEFFRSLGINIKQLYGQTEASVFICAQPDGQVKADTVGTAYPGVELRLADNNEVFYRSPGVFHSYYKNPESTADTKDAEGWVATGDAGFFDEDGHLKIIDRAKDVGRMTDGSMFAPKYIENKLKFFPFIKEAVAFGDEKDYATAFICIDIEAVGNWAERRNLAYSGYTDLSARDEVYDLLQECVESVNADLARDEKLSGSQIKRYLLLHKELDADDGELTRTRKVRRRIVAEKYAVLITALDDPQQTHCEIDSQMTFEDGRTGNVHADLQIRESVRIKSHVHTLAA